MSKISIQMVIEAARELREDKVVEAFTSGKTITEIHREFGHSRDWVGRILKKRGVYEARPVASPKPFCARGHDMAEFGVPIPKEKGGGRYCLECKRLRGRVEWKEQKK